MKKIIALLAFALSVNAFTAVAQQPADVEIPDLSAYILTPKPAATPRINGAKVFGLRPGSPCLYTIAATGDRPMTFSAEGLPKGLKLDSATGRITGTLKKRGTYHIMLKATNDKGSYERELRIVVGDHP